MPKKAIKKNKSEKVEMKIQNPEPEKTEEQIQRVIQEAEPKKEWRVLDRYFKYVRTYSIKDHGKDAGKLAKQFAGKIGGYVN